MNDTTATEDQGGALLRLASTDQLGLLPEPVAFMSDDGNRLAFHAHRDYTRPLVPMAQALAMVAAERERCASLSRGAIHEATRAGSADALLIISDLHRRISAGPNVRGEAAPAARDNRSTT